MALLTRLHMLLVCATAGFTIIAIFRGRCRLRTIVAVLVALLASLHVLFVRTMSIGVVTGPLIGSQKGV